MQRTYVLKYKNWTVSIVQGTREYILVVSCQYITSFRDEPYEMIATSDNDNSQTNLSQEKHYVKPKQTTSHPMRNVLIFNANVNWNVTEVHTVPQADHYD